MLLNHSMPSALHGHLALSRGGRVQPSRRTAPGRHAGVALVCAGIVACWVIFAVVQRRDIPDSAVASAPSPAASSGQAFVPFSIESVFAAHNRLVVSIVNDGSALLTSDLVVSVDGGAPHAVPAGALPLPGAVASIALDDVVVQRRAPVTVEVRTADQRAMRMLSVVVAPDQPNDLELAAARVDPDGTLVAVVRNHSPIPLHGSLVIAAREAVPSYALRARTEVALDIAAGGSQEVRVGHVGAVDLAQTEIALSTDAINDTDVGNDVYRP